MDDDKNELQWGCIARLIDRITDLMDGDEWNDYVNMIAEAYTEAEKETDPVKLFFDWYQFFFRFYYRVKSQKEPLKLNEIYNDSRLENHDNREMFRIANYDYKSFLWAKSKGFSDYITNGYLLIPKDVLSPAELKSFDKKVLN